MPRLTDITEKNAAPEADYLLHVVDPNDPTDNPAGTSFRMTVANLVGGFIASLGLYFNKTDDTSDDITAGTTNLFMTTAERAKLSGIQTGATANATDAQLRDRSTHTGTQAASTISDFNTAADGRVAAGIASHEAESDPHAQYQLRDERAWRTDMPAWTAPEKCRPRSSLALLTTLSKPPTSLLSLVLARLGRSM